MALKKEKSESRNEQMLNDPLGRLIPKLAVPTIISMLITSVYNMADTFFVSQLGTSASGAVGIVFSAMALIQAFSFMFGMGAGNNISRLLGAGEDEKAKQYASTSFFTGLAFGIVVLAIGLIFMNPIIKLLGSTDTIAPYASDYARFIFIAAPFTVCSFILNNILRYQGYTTYAMIGIASGGILNIILDPIFIFACKLGTSGAGLATGLSQFVSFCILLTICNTHKETIRITPKKFRFSAEIYGRILYTGLPSLARQGVASISTVILNTIAGPYGDAAIAAMSIVSRITMFINSVIVGFGQGFQPVCAFNFGAEKYKRVRKAFLYCIKVTTIILIIMCIIAFIISGGIIKVFRDDPEVIEIGTYALRAQLITMPLWGFYVMSNMFSQSIGYGVRSTLIACARQGIFLIPVLLILPRFFGLKGLQLSQPLADIISFIFALILILGIIREIRRKEKSQESKTLNNEEGNSL